MPQIVIVDDRASNLSIYARLAASIEDGVVVRTFGDPAEALVWLREGRPDLVISDYKMPSMDGAEFIRNVRLLPLCEDVPVVVITIHEDRGFRLRALEAGATDFLHSPVDHHEFVTRARNLLRMRKQQLLLASRADSLKQELEVSERSREHVLRDSRERLAQVIDTVPVMISAAGPDGRLLFVNALQGASAGLEPGSLVGRDVADLFGVERGDRSRSLDRLVFETGRALPSFEEEITDQAGHGRVLLVNKSPLMGPAQGVQGVLTSCLDITARKRIEANLHWMAHHDALTELPNRALLRERIRTEVGRARRGDQPFALHLLDLDGFKTVNDIRGHSAGDRFLKVIAQRLCSAVGEDDLVARLGGDEFAILQTRVAGGDEAAGFAARLLDVLREPVLVDGEPIKASGSIGIALHPVDGADVEDLLKNADLAMYRAKADDGNHYCFYAADMHARALGAARLDAELRLALSEGQFVLHYQPQVDLRDGSILGAEALLRWNRPGVGLEAPGAFLSRAEETGLIIPLSEWVLEEACREACGWAKSGLPPLRVSVNLSPVQFRKRTVPLLVANVLARTGLDPRCLDLELTESIVLRDVEAVAADLRQIVDLGVTLSIDDFGTGFSALNYIKQLPVSRLKIDQCFVRNLASDVNDAAIVRAVTMLGHSLDLVVVAEGVETLEHMNRLKSEGVQEAQGYYFGRPMPAPDFMALVARQMPRAMRA